MGVALFCCETLDYPPAYSLPYSTKQGKWIKTVFLAPVQYFRVSGKQKAKLEFFP